VINAQLHALLISNTNRLPGFSGLLQQQHLQDTDKSSNLLCLLRRVVLWYYYRVMYDPLDQLLALNSSYELLFQLMTPHQQLSCMADVLLVMACPTLQGKW
jgi:hypothetical protein